MPYLIFYQKERQLFQEAFQTTVSDGDIQFIANKIVRHFKISSRNIQIDIYGYRNAMAYYNYIRLPHNPSFGFICHELAHIHQRRKDGNTKHTKKLMTIIKRFVNYCTRQNFWKAELEKRNQPKPKITKQQILQKKLRNEHKMIKKMKTRIKRLQTCLKKRQKREKRYNKKLRMIVGHSHEMPLAQQEADI